MKPRRVLGAVAIALLCATAQPAASGNKEQLEACANSVLDGQDRNVVFAGHRFHCPGKIIAADEEEAKLVTVVRETNAYFKGALVHRLRARPDDKMTYFITVENWTDPKNCKILWPRMQIRRGGWFRLAKEFASEFTDISDEWEKGWNGMMADLQGDWEAAARVIVAKSIEKWARGAWPKCKAEWATATTSVSPQDRPMLVAGEEIRTGGGLCLDVNAPEIRNAGTRVQVWACNSSHAQSWTYDRAAASLRIASGLCLDVNAPEITKNGGRVQVWPCTGAPQQKWTPTQNGGLRNAGGLCLDVHAPEQATNGGRVQVWQCNGSAQQRFTSRVF